MTYWLKSCLCFFCSYFKLKCLTSEFGLKISEIRSTHCAFVLLYRYVFVCQMESHSVGPVNTQWFVSMLAECCFTVCKAGLTLKQHWIDVSCLTVLQLLFQFCNVAFKKFIKVGYLRKHFRTCVLAHSCMPSLHTRALAYLRTWAPCHTCVLVYLRTHTCVLRHLRTHALAYLHICKLAYWRKYLHTYMHLRTCTVFTCAIPHLPVCASTCALAYLLNTFMHLYMYLRM